MTANEQGADATDGRWLTIPRTLCFVTNGDDVLMMKRAANRRVFPNRYNGVGGHIERGEDPRAGVIREVKEETGLEIDNVQLCAIHHIDAGADSGIMLFVFKATAFTREALANDEGALFWTPREELTTLDLVDDLPEALPRILAMSPDDAPLFAHVSYNEEDQIVLRYSET